MPVGAGGSRLLRGNHPEHEALEAEAAAFFGAESALFFGGGFIANLALFSTLPQRGDLVVHDALIHASVHDGMRLGKAERGRGAPQRCAEPSRTRSDWRGAGGTGTPWIAVESLYSMDGDRAPLDDLVAVADRHEAMLVIDEAHATGVSRARRARARRAPRRPRQRHRAAHLRQGAGRHGRARAGAAARSATFSSIARAPSSTRRRLRR